MIAPRTPGDWSRQATRRNRPPLPQGRPVTQLTAGDRERLLADLLRWSDMCGLNLRTLLENPLLHIERINAILQMYGRRLYDAGKTYNIYVESVNSIASFKPVLKRQLQPAWDLAFAWVREERPIHHIAMPWQVLLAMLSVALGWGWLEMAGLLALGWGALLRTSEMTNSLRKDLLLPSDTLGANKFALLSLLEPKLVSLLLGIRVQNLTLVIFLLLWKWLLQISSHTRSCGLFPPLPSGCDSKTYCVHCRCKPESSKGPKPLAPGLLDLAERHGSFSARRTQNLLEKRPVGECKSDGNLHSGNWISSVFSSDDHVAEGTRHCSCRTVPNLVEESCLSQEGFHPLQCVVYPVVER